MHKDYLRMDMNGIFPWLDFRVYFLGGFGYRFEVEIYNQGYRWDVGKGGTREGGPGETEKRAAIIGEYIIGEVFVKFGLLSPKSCHSCVFLAGIQDKFNSGCPIKAFEHDKRGVFRFYLL